MDPKDDRWIINGAHEASKLQDYLDGFITKFVLCKKCKNPETVISIKDGRILFDCKACGHIGEADPRQKLSSFIIKNAPTKGGKKDKSNKKAERRARKLAQQNNGTADNSDEGRGSPGESGSDNADDDDDYDEAGSDDELTRRINAQAKELDEPEQEDKEIEWSVDMSEAAIKARAQELPDDLKRALVIEGAEDGEDAAGPYDSLGKWIVEQAVAKGGVSKVEDVDIYLKAKELGIETKHRTLAVLAQTLFDDNIIKQVSPRSGMLKRMITSEKHEKAFLGGTERLVGIENPKLISQVSGILLQYYQNDLVSEETLKAFGSKASKKYTGDIAISKKVRKSAEKFIEWLETAESDEEESDDE